MTKVYLTDGAVKVNLNDLPKEAWVFLRGGTADDINVMDFYRAVPWLYAAVNKRANAVASMPFALLRGGEDVEDPNAALPWWHMLSDLLDGLEADRTLYGAGYWLKERSRLNKLARVRRLAPRTVAPQFSEVEGLTGFRRALNSGERDLDLEDVVYSWIPSRDKELGPGTSPARAAIEAAGFLKNMDIAGSSFFERGMLSPVIVSVEDMMPVDSERVSKWFEKLAAGVSNAFRSIGVGGSKIHAEKIGHSLGELAVPELTASKREDIATALGVPQTLLFSNAANYATAVEDRKAFYDETVLPECQKIERVLNEQLFDELGFEFVFRPEEMELYQDDKEQEAGLLALLFDRQALTINEFRERMGLEPMTGGDERRQSPTMDARPAPTSAPEPAQDTTNEAQPPTPRSIELDKFRRFATTRVEEGKPEKIEDFTSAVIPPLLLASMKGALSVAGTADDVAAVFDGAAVWENYP